MMLGMGVLREPKTWRRERPKTGTRRSSDLTPEEQANVRRALVFLKTRLGSWPAVAKAMGAEKSTVWRSAHKRNVSAGLALRAARVAGEPLERLLTGSWPAPGVCPHCGRS